MVSRDNLMVLYLGTFPYYSITLSYESLFLNRVYFSLDP